MGRNIFGYSFWCTEYAGFMYAQLKPCIEEIPVNLMTEYRKVTPIEFSILINTGCIVEYSGVCEKRPLTDAEKETAITKYLEYTENNRL